MQNKREIARAKRHMRIRLKIRGSVQRPRLVIYRSLKNLSAQVINDAENKILFSMNTCDKEIKQKFACGGNVKAAEYFGEVLSRRLKEKGIDSVVFDRAGYLYHGRVKAFAENLRKGGLKI